MRTRVVEDAEAEGPEDSITVILSDMKFRADSGAAQVSTRENSRPEDLTEKLARADRRRAASPG
ncbi:MAG: hypothetical protein AB1486_29070 [Planctomycetota bacterium]